MAYSLGQLETGTTPTATGPATQQFNQPAQGQSPIAGQAPPFGIPGFPPQMGIPAGWQAPQLPGTLLGLNPSQPGNFGITQGPINFGALPVQQPIQEPASSSAPQNPAQQTNTPGPIALPGGAAGVPGTPGGPSIPIDPLKWVNLTPTLIANPLNQVSQTPVPSNPSMMLSPNAYAQNIAQNIAIAQNSTNPVAPIAAVNPQPVNTQPVNTQPVQPVVNNSAVAGGTTQQSATGTADPRTQLDPYGRPYNTIGMPGGAYIQNGLVYDGSGMLHGTVANFGLVLNNGLYTAPDGTTWPAD